MLEYKIISYNTKALPSLGEDNWNLNCIHDGMMFFSREIKRKRESKELDLTGFELFYLKYPRKCSRGNAEKVWNRLTENQRILAMEGLKKYLIYWKKKGIQKEFIPHPSTWLNPDDQRWNDDLSEVPETAIIQTNDKARAEDNEEKKNREEKEALDKKIEQYKRDPEKWKQINEQALSELSESQKQSTMRDILVSIKIRMLISKL